MRLHSSIHTFYKLKKIQHFNIELNIYLGSFISGGFYLGYLVWGQLSNNPFKHQRNKIKIIFLDKKKV